jgi:phosphate transport system substrate-binding protein
MSNFPTPAAQPASKAGDDHFRTEESLFLQRAREHWKEDKARRIHYTKKFDLSGLPSYQPERRVSGPIRQWGVNYIADSGLVGEWERGFRSHHPEVTFSDHLKSTILGVPGLYTGVADLAPMGRQLIWDELTAYQRETDSLPLEITFATGSYDVGGWTFALAAMVHKDNPLNRLSIPQLDGIFGAQRSGGWKGLIWDTSVARGPERNIRTWGQLGLGGEWAERPINVYGYNLKFHFPDEFSKKVFGGGDKWNETLIEYANKAAPDGSTLILAGDQFMADLSRDRYGIAYGGVQYLTPETKALALAPDDRSPAVELSLDNVQNRSYPLTRDVFYYVRREADGGIAPRLREFLRYVLSREGQLAVQADGKYLPLTAAAAAEQVGKLS